MGTESTIINTELAEELDRILALAMYADDDDAGNDDSDDGSDDADDDGTDDTDDDDGDDSDDEQDDDESDPVKLKEQSAEKDRYIAKLKKENAKWRRRFREASAGKDEGDDKGKDDADKGEAAKLSNENRTLKLQLGMADALGEHQFQKGAKALAQAMVLDAIDSDDDLDDALEDIPTILEDVLKEHPYLLKTEDKSDGKDEDDGDDKPTSGRSTSKKKKQGDDLSEEELYKKFPALRRR